jgi:Protein of unknown function (DUF2637)
MTHAVTFDTLVQYATGPAAEWAAAGVMLAIALGLILYARRPPSVSRPAGIGSAAVGRLWLIGLAVAAAGCVAGLGGVRSFEAVSAKFDSALVPLTADGMIIACTNLRLAALTRGWRLPGSLATTYGFIAGTVWLNVAAAHGWTDGVAHALAPVSYAVLVEFLAHLLRLHLRLAPPSRSSRPRISLTWLMWVTSPVVTTRVWLHLARTGGHDPVAARALVQQVIRMSSRLRTICPSRPLLAWTPLDAASAARAAALQTIRDGLLSAGELAALLPDDGRLAPGALLALVDGAAVRCTTPDTTPRTDDRTGAQAGVRTSALAPAHSTAPHQVHHDPAPTTVPAAPVPPAPTSRVGRDELTDAELVAELHRHADAHNGGAALSQREVMRVLGVGTPKAKRLAALAGWTTPTTPATTQPHHAQANGQPVGEARQLPIIHAEPDPPRKDDEATNSADSSDRLEARNTR